LRARFDGKVFVPDEPLNLPQGAKTFTSEDVRRAMEEQG
jgi:hypothetical protein